MTKPLYMYKHRNGMVSVITDEQHVRQLRDNGVVVQQIIVVPEDAPVLLCGRKGQPSFAQLVEVWNCIVRHEGSAVDYGDLAKAERIVAYGSA